MYTIVLSSAFIASFLVLCFFYLSKFTKKTYWHMLPGPKETFMFGNALNFYNVGAHELLPILQGIVAKYGKIVRLSSASERVILATDGKFIEFILSSNKILEKSKDYKYYHNWLGTGLLTSTGTKWKLHRKIITPAFHFSILQQFISSFEKNGNILIKKLAKEVDKDSMDIYPYMTLCSLDIICETGMGTSVNAQLNEHTEYVKNVQFMCTIGVKRALSLLSAIFYPLTSLYYQEKRALKVVHTFSNYMIDSRRKSLEKSSKVEEGDHVSQNSYTSNQKLAFLDLLLKSTIDGKPLTKDEIREEVDTFMFEGHDTTTSAITFTLYLLSKHPDVQQKVYNEQRILFNDFERALTYNDLIEMKYLEMVIKESIRLYPVAPFIGRQVRDEVQYEGSIIPKNTKLILYIYGIHRDPDYFSSPEEFIPERFESPHDMNTYSYIPFSAGSRNCIGQKYAMLEIKSIISKIIRNFHVLPSQPPHHLILSAETIMRSKNGVRLSLKKRKYL